jgi:hypothetical protein
MLRLMTDASMNSDHFAGGVVCNSTTILGRGHFPGAENVHLPLVIFVGV